VKLSTGFLLRAGASLTLALVLHAQQIKITSISAISARGEIPLESSVGTSQAKGSNPLKAGFGVASSTMLVELPGDQSSVRLKAGDVQGFLIHSENSWSDGTLAGFAPTEALRLLVVKKGKARQYVTMDVKTTVVYTRNKESSPLLTVDVSQYDDHTAKITPKVLPLLPGEYAFMSILDEVHEDTNQRYQTSKVNLKNLGRYRMYCFAIE
jgi:hypothetical protein